MSSGGKCFLRLSDQPILDIEDQMETEGYFDVYLPSKNGATGKKKCVKIPFNRRETAEKIREKIEKKSGFNTSGYYLVSEFGNIADGTTLDQYFPLIKDPLKSKGYAQTNESDLDERSEYFDGELFHSPDFDQFSEITKFETKDGVKNRSILLVKIGVQRNEYLQKREEVLKQREKRVLLKNSIKTNETQHEVAPKKPGHAGCNRAGSGKLSHIGGFMSVHK